MRSIAIAMGCVLCLASSALAAGARDAARPTITSSQLPNGLRILILPDPASSTVTASLWIGAGWVYDPRDREGIAGICALAHERRIEEAMMQGRIGKPYLAESFEGAVFADHTVFSSGALAQDLDLALASLASVVQAGDKDFIEVPTLKREAILNIMRTRMTPGLVARSALAEILFGGRRPLGFSPRFQTLLGILPPDVRAFHDRYYRPDSAILSVEGAVDPAMARAAATRRFGDWRAGAALEPPAWGRAAPAPARAGVTLIDDPDATQAIIIAGLSCPGREDTQGFATAQLLHQVVGGRRIEAVIDSALGPQSGRHQFLAQLQSSARGSELTLEIVVPTNFGPQVLAELRRALADLARSGIDAATVDSEIRARAAALPFRLETPSARMRETVLRLLAGQPFKKAAEDPRSEFATLNRAAVRAEMQKLLDPPRIAWVIHGRGNELSPLLSAAAIDHARGDPFEVVTGRLLASPSQTILKLPGPIATVQAEEMILAAIETQGGFPAIERIENYTTEDTVYVQTSGPPVSGERKLFVNFPDRYREELVMVAFLGRKLIQVVNGKDVWRNNVGKVGNVSGPRKAELENRLWLDGLRVFHRYGEPGAQAFLVDPDAVGGVTLDGLQITSADGKWVRFYFHPRSRLVVKRSFEKPGDKIWAVDEIYTDYRPVEGVFIPFISATYLDGEYATETHTQTINFNAPLDRDLFLREE